MKKQFAFILMGGHYEPDTHQAHFETDKQVTSIFTVRDTEEASRLLARLASAGYGAVELCGAFGKEGADRLIRETENRIAVGYVVHNAEQDALFTQFFGGH